jgi:catalase
VRAALTRRRRVGLGPARGPAASSRARRGRLEIGIDIDLYCRGVSRFDRGLDVDRGLLTMASVLYDAVLVAGGRASVDTLRRNGAAIRYVAEAYKHGKAVGAIGEGVDLLREAPLNDARLSDNGLISDAAVVTLAAPGDEDLEQFAAAFAQAVARHRHFDRNLELVPA